MPQQASPGRAAGDRAGGATRVLFANEPRAYREALAQTFRLLRPEAEVLEAEAELLAGLLPRLSPDMVVCDRATGAVLRVPVWVELYSGGSPSAVIGVAGSRREVADVQLAELVSLADIAHGLAQQG